MGKIIKLDKALISKTSAREIAASPSKTLKELVDNSIDAKSSEIIINTSNSGLDLLEVIDNGEGMNEDDIKICFESHTTSKIKTHKDLDSIKTLGFRGEALKAITEISTTTIVSSDNESGLGYKVIVDTGTLMLFSKTSSTRGTKISVENLFKNVPARKKYYLGNRTEDKSLYKIILHYALTFPHISFTYKHNGKISLKTSGEGLLKALMELFPDINPQHLLDVNYSDNNFTLTGYIGTPQLSAENQTLKFLAVNNRPVSNKDLAKTIKGAFGNLIDTKSQPAYIVQVNTDFQAVDVNIHPAKEVVLIQNNNALKNLIYSSIKDVLNKNDLSYTNKNNFNYKTPDQKLFYKLKDSADEAKKLIEIPARVIQLNNLYLVYAQEDTLVIVDQHAAHEKIIYEELVAKLEKAKQKNKTVRILLNLNGDEKSVLNNFTQDLEYAGIKFNKQREEDYYLEQIPEYLDEKDASTFVKELLHDLEDIGKIRNLPSKTEKTLSYLACRSAIKAGEMLTNEEIIALISKLQNSKIPYYTCPHGRPLKFEVSSNQLAKLFKRK